MIKLIKASEYKSMPWKNGQGITNEIEIYPENADLSKNDFDFRISSATVRLASPFSKFPGFDRILTVWQGGGLIINKIRYEPLLPFTFSGETEIYSEPLGDVVDLGIIFNREKYAAHMELEAIAAGTTEEFNLGNGFHYLFCCKGSFTCADKKVEMGDTLKISGPVDVSITTLGATKILLTSIARK